MQQDRQLEAQEAPAVTIPNFTRGGLWPTRLAERAMIAAWKYLDATDDVPT
jgi:hypothetical protein